MRYRVLIYAGLAFVVSMPAEAQKLQMALAAAADFTPVYPFGKIPTNIKGIVAIAELGKEKPKELVASYFKVGDNPGIGDEKVAEQKQAVGDSPQVVLRYAAPHDWALGKYRLDISADGRPWRSAEWEVVPPLPPAILGSAGDIMPLRAGTTWPMVFTSWSSPEVRVTLLGAETDRNGVYHMSAAITVPGVEQDGVHVRHMRDGKLAEEELWQVGGGGIGVIGRLVGTKPLRVDPPLPIIPFPLPEPEKSWDWRPGEEGQWKFQGWGPVLLAGPNGEQPGYVIVMEQSTMARTMTRERDIIPGLGINREIFVDQTGSGVTLFHQEYVLTGAPTMSGTNDLASPGSEKP